ncbi:MAG TPA: hypothetical protein PLS84_10535 [Salinivirgaceae bacterium]|nr:hypothetical protein [Salinivirgaceae bacterium]
MKRTKLNILLFSILVLLIVAYGVVRYYDTSELHYYKLTENFYLNKIDHFSKYSILKKSNSNYETVIENVEEMSVLENTYLIKFKENSALKYLYLYPSSDKYIVADNINDLDGMISSQNIVWDNPWQVAENETLNNPSKLTSQILLILIILLVFYIIVRKFNLKRACQKSKNASI